MVSLHVTLCCQKNRLNDPLGYFLQMISARRWLAGNVLVWGIVTACTAATHNYHSLLTARIFLGIFEASIAPTQIVITSQWYTKSEQAPRASLWYCGLGAGQIIGAFLSWAFQQAEHSAFASWRIMFVALGIITIVTAIVTYLVLPDTPMTASFLSPAEKLALLKHVSVNQTGIENRHFKLSQVLEILQDVQLWLMVVLAILVRLLRESCSNAMTDNRLQSALPTGVVSVYSATILRNAGFKPDIAALLLMPQGVASIIAAVVVGYGVLRTSHRWAWIVLCCMMGILGGALLSFMPKSNHAGLLAGIYLTSSITPTLLLLYQWTASNVAGLTKRSVSLALVAGSFSAGSIIAPQTFQARDAPQYLPAKITSLASQVAGALLAFLLFCYYVWANKRKDKRSASLEGQNIQGNEQDLWENMTDKENQTFRYVY